jgi:hypothetical protein
MGDELGDRLGRKRRMHRQRIVESAVCQTTITAEYEFQRSVRAIFPSGTAVGILVVGLFALLSSVHQSVGRTHGALPVPSRLGRDIENSHF